MSRYSKGVIHKAELKFAKLQEACDNLEFNYRYPDKNFYRRGISRYNKALITRLSLELMFINIRINQLSNGEISWIHKILLKNEKIFLNDSFYSKSYFDKEGIILKAIRILRRFLHFKKRIVKLFIEKNLNELKIAVKKAYKNDPTSNKQLLFIRNFLFKTYEIITSYDHFVRHVVTTWYIYVARFILVSTIHFIPFIQLSTLLFYNQRNSFVIHPITAYLLHFAPWLLPLLRKTMPLCNGENFSFVVVFFYFYVFIIRRKRYKIPSKVGYQGAFAAALMLLRYSMQVFLEAVIYSYKFTKRLFFLRKVENFTLLGDDFDFFLEDLEDLREERETIIHMGESLFSLEDHVLITKIYETSTVFAFIGVIALLYNCMYFICKGRKPIIPVVTKTIRRMVIDRNDKEPL